MSGDFSGTPLAVGTVKGQREWKVDTLGRLRGITHSQVWLPTENMATCKAVLSPDPIYSYNGTTGMVSASLKQMERHDEAETPADECTCGFYAYHQGAATIDRGDSAETIVGVIEGYGQTIIGTKGFRSQKARIVALVENPKYPRVRFNYPDAQFFPDVKAMLEAHQLDWFGPTPADEDFWTRDIALPDSYGWASMTIRAPSWLGKSPSFSFGPSGLTMGGADVTCDCSICKKERKKERKALAIESKPDWNEGGGE